MALPLDNLIAALAKLPGIGYRSAERIAIGLVGDRSRMLLHRLVHELQTVEEHITVCSRCGGITDRENDPCGYCTSSRRDETVLCVVERPSDILLMEKAGAFNGRYHVLGGRISPMDGEGPEQLRLQGLVQRLEAEPFEEVILALNTDVESDATAGYLADLLGKRNLKVTRLAVGIPAGSGLAYSDAVTLSRALNGRLEL